LSVAMCRRPRGTLAQLVEQRNLRLDHLLSKEQAFFKAEGRNRQSKICLSTQLFAIVLGSFFKESKFIVWKTGVTWDHG